MNNLIIRKAQKKDSNQIYNMINALEEKTFDKNIFLKIINQNFKNKNIYYFIAEINKQVVGFISLHIQYLLHHNGPAAEIQELYVDSDYRNQGIGKLLLDKTKQITGEKQCKVLETTSNIKREKTHKFYSDNGFKNTHHKFTIEY